MGSSFQILVCYVNTMNLYSSHHYIIITFREKYNTRAFSVDSNHRLLTLAYVSCSCFLVLLWRCHLFHLYFNCGQLLTNSIPGFELYSIRFRIYSSCFHYISIYFGEKKKEKGPNCSPCMIKLLLAYCSSYDYGYACKILLYVPI